MKNHKITYLDFKKDKPQFAYLFDPGKMNLNECEKMATLVATTTTDYIFIGGSTFTGSNIDQYITIFQSFTGIPIVLFPGNLKQLSTKADAVLFLSLISGTNSDYLIGNHVLAAEKIKQENINTIPTGYILIDGGRVSAVEKVSRTKAIAQTRHDLIKNTALAGEFLGNRLIYLEAGSGALIPVSAESIRKVKAEISIPLIVGGGINSSEKAAAAANAGADTIVVGNAIEKNPGFLHEVSETIANFVKNDSQRI